MCEDFPCCGHEQGCCPDFDPETGEQLNMKCLCGAVLLSDSLYSICDACLQAENCDDYDEVDWDDYLVEDDPEWV